MSEQPVHTSLWDLKDEAEMGHIQLSREADLVVVCPATADLLAKMAAGIADDLATTLLLATDKKVLAAPAMNVRMWQHEATQRNVARLRADGVTILEPDEGEMACGEYGPGRLPEPEAILAAIEAALGGPGPLAGRHVIVTAGPTHEPIDPVRVIANRSSGKQGFAIAEALAALGARVTLVAGPVALATPPGVARLDVETARQMDEAVRAALPADAAVLVAAVADWRVEPAPGQAQEGGRARRGSTGSAQSRHPRRPRREPAPAAPAGRLRRRDRRRRRARPRPSAAARAADWILANDVSGDVMGGDANRIHLITRRRRRGLGDDEQGRGRPPPRRSASPRPLRLRSRSAQAPAARRGPAPARLRHRACRRPRRGRGRRA